MIIKYIPILFLFMGCAASKGYSGPELPADRVANLRFSTSDGTMSITDRYINGVKIDVPTYAFDYPAGSLKIALSYTVDKSNHCTDINNCIVKTEPGKCEGNIVTKGGRNYVVSLHNKSDVVSAQATAKGYYDLSIREDEPNVGTITCKETKKF